MFGIGAGSRKVTQCDTRLRKVTHALWTLSTVSTPPARIAPATSRIRGDSAPRFAYGRRFPSSATKAKASALT